MLYRTLLPLLFILLNTLPSLSAGTIAEANELYEQAMTALDEMNDNSAKSVEAAIFLQKAKKIYQKHEQWPQVREVNSYLFYCKKKMNINELDAYISQLSTGKAKEIRKTFASIEKETSSSLSKDDSTLSYNETENFASNNPKEFLKIHMRYLEISERAIETNPSIAIKASRKSSAALQSWVAISANTPKIHASPFSQAQRSVDLMGKDTGFPLPNKKNTKKTVRFLQKKFGPKYKKPLGNSTARELYKMARQSLDQPDYAYVCAFEAARLAIHKNASDVSLFMDCINFLGKNFNIMNIEDVRNGILSKQRSKISKAITSLFANQNDTEANKTVGFSYCFIANNWKQGLNLLENSNDSQLKNIIAMERGKANSGNELKQVGDAWHKLSQDRNYKDHSTQMLQRSCHWYNKALKKTSGISKEQIESRLLKAAKKLPISGLEHKPIAKVKNSILHGGSWDKLNAALTEVKAKGRFFTGVTLLKGQSIRVFPNTKDRWTIWGSSTNYNGHRSHGSPYGFIGVRVGNGSPQKIGDVITGVGKVMLYCDTAGYTLGGRNGSIRCKVARVP